MTQEPNQTPDGNQGRKRSLLDELSELSSDSAAPEEPAAQRESPAADADPRRPSAAWPPPVRRSKMPADATAEAKPGERTDEGADARAEQPAVPATNAPPQPPESPARPPESPARPPESSGPAHADAPGHDQDFDFVLDEDVDLDEIVNPVPTDDPAQAPGASDRPGGVRLPWHSKAGTADADAPAGAAGSALDGPSEAERAGPGGSDTERRVASTAEEFSSFAPEGRETRPEASEGLDALRGITEPENVVGSGDLLEQLDALEEFEPSVDLAEGAEAGDAADDLEDWDPTFLAGEAAATAGSADEEPGAYRPSTPPSRTRGGSGFRRAAALLLVAAGAAAAWFHFLRPEETPAPTDGAPALARQRPAPTSGAAEATRDAGETVAAAAEAASADGASTADPSAPGAAPDALGLLGAGEGDPSARFADVAKRHATDTGAGGDLLGSRADGEDEDPTSLLEESDDEASRPPLVAVAKAPPAGDEAPFEVASFEDTKIAPDEIIVALQNGNTFQGVVKKLTDASIVLKLHNGEITLPWETLDGILPPDSEEYQPTSEFPDGFVEFEHGQRFYGKILLVNDRRVVMDVSGARLVFPRGAVDVDYEHQVFVRPSIQ